MSSYSNTYESFILISSLLFRKLKFYKKILDTNKKRNRLYLIFVHLQQATVVELFSEAASTSISDFHTSKRCLYKDVKYNNK